MAVLYIQEETLNALGDAIRAATGTSDLMSPAQMIEAINSISKTGATDIHYMVSGLEDAQYLTFDTTGCSKLKFKVNYKAGANTSVQLGFQIFTSYGYTISGKSVDGVANVPYWSYSTNGDANPIKNEETFSFSWNSGWNGEEDIEIDVSGYTSVVLKFTFLSANTSKSQRGYITLKNFELN